MKPKLTKPVKFNNYKYYLIIKINRMTNKIKKNKFKTYGKN